MWLLGFAGAVRGERANLHPRERERCWVSGGSPREEMISNKRGPNRKQRRSVCVVAEEGGGEEEGRGVAALVPAGQAGHSANIHCLNKYAVCFQGFSFPSSLRNGDHICWQVILMEVQLYIVWASPQENLRQPLWTCPLASYSDFHVFLSPSGTIFHNWQLQTKVLSVYLCNSHSWLDSLQFWDLLSSPLFKISFKCRSMTKPQGESALLAKEKCELRPHFP